MKRYILFNEEELSDLGKGNTIEVPLESGEIFYVMCTERYYDMLEEGDENHD